MWESAKGKNQSINQSIRSNQVKSDKIDLIIDHLVIILYIYTSNSIIVIVVINIITVITELLLHYFFILFLYLLSL